MIHRVSTFLVCLAFASIAACNNSHTRDADSGPITRADATLAQPDASAIDAGCPGGICACPADINPWDSRSPGSQCSVEGAQCGSNGGACGGALSCTCTSGAWQCLVAEPDPACSCGREPTMGSPCSDEGMTCGACCPGPGEWPALMCVDGRWSAGICPPFICPDLGCPVDRIGAAGDYCANVGQQCGNQCCSSPLECDASNHWVLTAEADCICRDGQEFVCGEGSCVEDQACVSECGPDDGLVFHCQPQREGCTGCGCYTDPGVVCEEREGHVFVRTNGFCG